MEKLIAELEQGGSNLYSYPKEREKSATTSLLKHVQNSEAEFLPAVTA